MGSRLPTGLTQEYLWNHPLRRESSGSSHQPVPNSGDLSPFAGSSGTLGGQRLGWAVEARVQTARVKVGGGGDQNV